jgi:hypothetical protein
MAIFDMAHRRDAESAEILFIFKTISLRPLRLCGEIFFESC